MTEHVEEQPSVPQARPVAAAETDTVSPADVDTALPDASPSRRGFSRKSAMLDLVVLGGLTFIVMLIVSGGAELARQRGVIGDVKEVIPHMTVAIGILTLGVVFGMLAIRRDPLKSIGWTSAAMGANVLVGIGLWVGIMILLLMFIMMLGLFWPSAFEDFTQARGRIEDIFPRISIPMILLMSLATGVYEEVLFRGFLLTRLGQLFGSPVAAVVVSSLLFGSLHIYEGYAAVIMITIFGLILAACTLWRRSLVAAMVAHFLFNTFQLIMLYLISETWE